MIDSPAWIEGGQSIALGANVKVARFARIEALDARAGVTRIAVGDDTTIQPFVHIGAVRSVTIGCGCLFASHVYITDHDHDYRDAMDPVIQNDPQQIRFGYLRCVLSERWPVPSRIPTLLAFSRDSNVTAVTFGRLGFRVEEINADDPLEGVRQQLPGRKACFDVVCCWDLLEQL